MREEGGATLRWHPVLPAVTVTLCTEAACTDVSH